MRLVTVFLFLALFVTACGKKGPLVYPEMLIPAAPSMVSLQQSGESLKLSFVVPSKDRAGQGLSDLAGITILRRDAMLDQSDGCSACMDDYYLFKKLNLDILPTVAQRKGNLILLLDGEVRSGRNYSYIVSAFTKEGVIGARSAAVTAGIVSPPVPPVLKAIGLPTEIDLEFAGLPPQKGTFVGYNVYRTNKGSIPSFWPLNREPLTNNRFSDVGLERRTTYVYTVRTVYRLSNGFIVESRLSNEAEGMLKDDE